MKNPLRARTFVVFALFVVISMACGSVSFVPAMPTFPPIPASPSTNNVQTGSSPLSGDWTAVTDFGRLAFTVSPDGAVVTTAVVQVSNWTCGGTTLTTELQSLSQWPISNQEFIGDVNLNGSFHTLRIDGAYDELDGKFSGTWEENAHGAVCSNAWESLARK